MPKGTTNNPNGRPAGTPNKLTKELRQKLKVVLDVELDRLPALLTDMESDRRVELVIKLLAYILPKVENVGAGYGEPVNFDFDDI